MILYIVYLEWFSLGACRFYMLIVYNTFKAALVYLVRLFWII